MRMLFIGAKKAMLSLSLVLCALSLHSNQSQAAVDFCHKTINWVVPFRAGGGADTWARFNAAFLAKHLPCQPEIKVINSPGGSSTKATNRYAATAEPDGLTLLSTCAPTQFAFLLGASRVKYDYKQWQPLLVYPTGGVFYTTPAFGIEHASQLHKIKHERLVYGSQGITSVDLVPLLSLHLLGLNVRPILGMRGRGAGRLAFERGEANIDFQTSAGYIKKVLPLVKAGKAVPLFTLGTLNEYGELTRDRQFPALPHFAEVYEMMHDEPPEGVFWEGWFAFYSAGFGAQKMLVIPKKTPRTIIDTYRRAIDAMHADPQYIAKKAAVIGAYEQATDDTAARLYRLGTSIPEGPERWIRNWLRKQYKLTI